MSFEQKTHLTRAFDSMTKVLTRCQLRASSNEKTRSLRIARP